MFSAEGGGYDSSFVFAGFKVGVGEAEEDIGKLVAGEEIGQEFHGVGAEDGDVVIGDGERG